MIAGAVYGIALNDSMEVAALAGAFAEPPYNRPPVAPVVYIKPRNCISFAGAEVPLPSDLEAVTVAATLGLLFARDTSGEDRVLDAIGAACLALDVSEPHSSYYRPAIRQRCRDGFLPLGAFAGFTRDVANLEIISRIDGQEAHRWSLKRLVRPLERLVADLTEFMTLRAGDLLMIGLAGDAPQARDGQRIDIMAAGLPSLGTRIVREPAA